MEEQMPKPVLAERMSVKFSDGSTIVAESDSANHFWQILVETGLVVSDVPGGALPSPKFVELGGPPPKKPLPMLESLQDNIDAMKGICPFPICSRRRISRPRGMTCHLALQHGVRINRALLENFRGLGRSY